MESNIFNIEIDRVLSDIRIITPFGEKAKKEMPFFLPSQEQLLRKELEDIQIFIGLIKTNPTPFEEIKRILNRVKDLRGSIHRAKNEEVLSLVELFEIKNYCIILEELSNPLNSLKIVPEAYRVTPITPLAKVFDPEEEKLKTFYIYDSYSQKLKDIRRDIKKAEYSIGSMRQEIANYIRTSIGLNLSPLGEVVVNKDDKDKIIFIQSTGYFVYSGESYLNITYKIKATEEWDQLQRQLLILKEQEELEEIEVRRSISREVANVSSEFLQSTETIGRLDLIIAKAEYSIGIDGIKPVILEEPSISIIEGRHPVVEKNLKSKGVQFTPISVDLKPGATLITGANMGGKTIALRTIGLISTMVQYGLFVPAHSASLGLSNYIFLSTGDFQSPESGLSTFGGEIYNINKILELTHHQGLILIDELARGTNPLEGAAISKAIVKYLKDKSPISVITTHFEGLWDIEGIKHLQVRGLRDINFQELKNQISTKGIKGIEIIQKYMDYRLEEVRDKHQIPKDALNIAILMGLKEEIIKEAEKEISM